MDVTNKDSILAAKKAIQDQEGKLHILVNKFASSLHDRTPTDLDL